MDVKNILPRILKAVNFFAGKKGVIDIRVLKNNVFLSVGGGDLIKISPDTPPLTMRDEDELLEFDDAKWDAPLLSAMEKFEKKYVYARVIISENIVSDYKTFPSDDNEAAALRNITKAELDDFFKSNTPAEHLDEVAYTLIHYRDIDSKDVLYHRYTIKNETLELVVRILNLLKLTPSEVVFDTVPQKFFNDKIFKERVDTSSVLGVLRVVDENLSSELISESGHISDRYMPLKSMEPEAAAPFVIRDLKRLQDESRSKLRKPLSAIAFLGFSKELVDEVMSSKSSVVKDINTIDVDDPFASDDPDVYIPAEFSLLSGDRFRSMCEAGLNIAPQTALKKIFFDKINSYLAVAAGAYFLIAALVAAYFGVALYSDYSQTSLSEQSAKVAEERPYAGMGGMRKVIAKNYHKVTGKDSKVKKLRHQVRGATDIFKTLSMIIPGEMVVNSIAYNGKKLDLVVKVFAPTLEEKMSILEKFNKSLIASNNGKLKGKSFKNIKEKLIKQVKNIVVDLSDNVSENSRNNGQFMVVKLSYEVVK